MNAFQKKKVLAHLNSASLHIIEATHILWNNEERDVSNEIRQHCTAIEKVTTREFGEKAYLSARKKLTKRG